MVVEVIDAPWAGVPVRIRWHNTALDMPLTRLPDDDVLEHSEKVCAPRARLNPARFAGVRVPRVDERRVAPPRPTTPGPASSLASWTTRGKDHPTARLSGPGPGQVWHRVQELAGRARKRLARRVPIATLDPLPGTARTPSLGQLYGRNQRARRLSHRHTRWRRPLRDAVASSKTRPVTADAQAIPSTKSGFFYAPRTRGYSIIAPRPNGGRGPSISTGIRSSAPPGCLA